MTNSAGKLVISYTYDTWGRWVYYIQDTEWSNVLGGINPLLYRGYVYDHETGLYYLQSRYYDFNTHRFLNADAFTSTGQGFTGNNMFTYCLNNPVMLVDPDGRCSRFLGFLWKIDCGKATCEDSVNYNPSATRVAVIYDGRYSGLLRTDILAKGFRDQGQVVINDLETIHAVESFAYSDMDGFVNAWNSLGGEYDKIYILGHGYPGGMSCDGKSISNSGNEAYSFWDLNPVPARTVYLYTCHGASFDGQGNSVAAAFSVITGGTVYGVIDGKLSYDYWTLTPYPTKGGRWSVTPPLS